jgi:hypothetical protein
VEADTDLDKGLKTHCVYAAILNAEQIYMDQTGHFPAISSGGNAWSYMSMMEIQSWLNQSNNKAGQRLRSFKVMEQKMIARGIKPRLMTLVNEA